jgi:uncharacterized protein (DUF1015 family)
MAEVQPLRALRYNTDRAGALTSLIAPPYDVIDVTQRRELSSRSPYNVVGIDLPQGDDPYATAAALLRRWIAEDVMVRDDEPALWAIVQRFKGPDGNERERKGFFCRVRLSDYGTGKIRPHERTHPAAKQDRLELMRATRANLSPIFSLYADEGEVWSVLEPATASAPWGHVTDDEGTTHTLWRITEAAAIVQVQELMTERELLIADGHHRYETARTYAQEVGGEGEHTHVLMCLVSMSDPGLAVFPTHRLIASVDAAHRAGLDELLKSEFRVTDIELQQLTETGANGLPTFGMLDGRTRRARRVELASQATADRALADRSPSYRRLDTAVLEKLILEGALGMTEDDISNQRGLAYARDLDQAVSLIEDEGYELAFMLRPTPIEQVRAIAGAGETMPPKSTYFFPKLPSGLLFNALY